jgi:F-box protein, helicase, 18
MMTLTQEQIAIIQSVGNIKINAVAGSGKTTTVIEYAKSRPSTSRILYLAFNKSVKLEAQRKFVQKGLSNVTIETAHSLAYRNVVFNSAYKVKSKGYTTSEVVEILRLQSAGEKHSEYVIASHISKFISYFCNSDKRKVQELNYLETITDDEAKKFVTIFYKEIEEQTRNFLAKMDRAEIEITHDFYLKKFQLSTAQLYYDYILFDEGQDASPAMLDVFLRQKATKVIVGDTHQQIYGWRHAVNSLEKVDFPTYTLSVSFRFGQVIADLAKRVLELKQYIDVPVDLSITGKGVSTRIKTKAVIARTNLGLLLKAIHYVTEKRSVQRIYFEGNINSYTYAEDGASLYDILSLYNGERGRVRDKLIKTMKNIEELEDYIEKTEDVQLAMMVEVVRKYGNKIPGILATIKERHVDNDEKSKAQMIFSTVHRCKGMEYDAIELADDFITEQKLEKIREDEGEELNAAKLNEEINLLYVAVTRTQYSIHIPEVMMPSDFPEAPEIHIVKPDAESKRHHKSSFREPVIAEWAGSEKIVERQSYSVEKIRAEHEEAYKPWSREEDAELKRMFDRGTRIPDISTRFGRTTGAIRSRLKKIGLIKTERIKKG